MSSSDRQVRRRTVHANGLEFPILEAGAGPLVICMHGFPDQAQSWTGFLERFAEAGYWAVAPAMRGYWPGGAAPDGLYRGAANGRDVLGIIDALGAKEASLIGHDFGARAVYAAANLDPARVRKLVGMAVPYGRGLFTAFVADGDQQRRSWYMFFFQQAFAEAAVQANDYAFIDRLWSEWSPGYALPPAERAALHEMFSQPGVLSQTLAYYRQLFTAPTDPKILEVEARANGPISVPTLYLHGQNDGCMSVELSDGIEKLFTNGYTRIVMPDVGHFLHLEQPDAVFDQVLRFLK